jgi:hypothetical protein
MMLVLPPKRFESSIDPKFDPIRHFPWFAKLDARRNKLPFLKAALEAWQRDGINQKQAAETFGVDERELRDYLFFRAGQPNPDDGSRKTFQAVLDDAYGHYVANRGRFGLRYHIELIAPFYGLKTRHVTELWETDPVFYPTGYR